MTPPPSISVIIRAKNAAATLPVAVRSALTQEAAGEFNVVIAVAPSSDGTRAVAECLVREHRQVRLVDNNVGSTGAGLNAATAA